VIVHRADPEDDTADRSATPVRWCAVAALAWLTVFLGPSDPEVLVPAFLLATTSVLGLAVHTLFALPDG
jgi:hypothetical protein